MCVWIIESDKKGFRYTMKLKDEVLKCLEEHRGQNVSGAFLAEQLYVTRSAIWKSIKSLRAEGYEIEAVTNRGYCLTNRNDIVSVNAILPHLVGEAKKFHFDIQKTVTSTNTLVKEAAAKGEPAGFVLIANEQTEGRGRLGRSFYSPASTGIYLSLLLRPNISASETLFLTTSAAVCVCRAIEQVAHVDAKIKWVNDIYIEKKKVCGILSEASINCETGTLDFAVIGIGLNVTTKKFPTELDGKAGSIYHDTPTSHPVILKLITTLLNELGTFSTSFQDKTYLEEYRSRSLLIGENIKVVSNQITRTATVLDIDKNAHLVIQYEDGERDVLRSGEVQVPILVKP